jgi:hypothetical protein
VLPEEVAAMLAEVECGEGMSVSRAFEAILALKSDSQNRPFERDKSTAASRNAKRSVDITIEDGLPLAVLSACFV